MASPAKVTVGFEILQHETGLWCPACALPSGHRVFLAVTMAGRTTLRVESRCRDCGNEAVTHG